MRRTWIILFILYSGLLAQNFNTYVSFREKPIEIGLYPVFLNYGSDNHFHSLISIGFGLTSRDKIIFKGGMFTETRFQINWFRKVYTKPFVIYFSPGLGSLWGTFIDLNGGMAIHFSHGVYVTNGIEVNLYLDSDQGKPFQSDSPLWYIINFHAPMGKQSQFHAEFGLPVSNNSYTIFGAGLKFLF